MKVFNPILICLLVLAGSIGKAQTEQEKKTEKKTLAQFGITLINGVTDLSRPFIETILFDDDSYLYDDDGPSLSSTGNTKNNNFPASQLGATFSAEMPIYKNIHFFTSTTFLKYSYSYLDTYTSFSLGTHTIKQYHLPLQLLYYRLGKSHTHIVPKIGVTFTYHIETIEPISSQGSAWIDSYTKVNYYKYVSVESASIKKIVPSLSIGGAFKFIRPKLGTLEVGLNVIYKIKNPTHKYTIHQVKYDATNNSLLSDETEYKSSTVKNTIVQFYITWYPNFLRITKNK